MIDFDSEYDTLFVGLSKRPPSYGKDADGGMTVFLSFADGSITGLEVDGYKQRILNKEFFGKDVPFSSYLNSRLAHNLAIHGTGGNHLLYMD